MSFYERAIAVADKMFPHLCLGCGHCNNDQHPECLTMSMENRYFMLKHVLRIYNARGFTEQKWYKITNAGLIIEEAQSSGGIWASTKIIGMRYVFGPYGKMILRKPDEEHLRLVIVMLQCLVYRYQNIISKDSEDFYSDMLLSCDKFIEDIAKIEQYIAYVDAGTTKEAVYDIADKLLGELWALRMAAEDDETAERQGIDKVIIFESWLLHLADGFIKDKIDASHRLESEEHQLRQTLELSFYRNNAKR